MKILIIDDSKEDRDLIIGQIKKIKSHKKIFTEEGECLKDAFNKIKSKTYDIIILDLCLPESDGIETVKTIKKYLEEQHKNTPIIVLTGIQNFSVGREAWSLGIKDYLLKDEIETQDLSRSLAFASYNKEKKSIVA